MLLILWIEYCLCSYCGVLGVILYATAEQKQQLAKGFPFSVSQVFHILDCDLDHILNHEADIPVASEAHLSLSLHVGLSPGEARK